MSFLKKKKGPSIDTQGPAQQREAALSEMRNAFTNSQGNLTEGQNRFNPGQAQALYTQGLNRFQNFDNEAKVAEDNAYAANYQPILNDIKATLGNQFAGMGSAGRNNSRGQYAQAVSSNDLADKAGMRLLEIRQAVRNNLLQENQDLFNPAFALQQQIAGFDTNKANNQMQFGQNLANARLGFQGGLNQLNAQNAQIAASERSQGKGGIGSMLGGGISLLSSVMGNGGKK